MGVHRWPVDSSHEGPVMWKAFSRDDVIVINRLRIRQILKVIYNQSSGTIINDIWIKMKKVSQEIMYISTTLLGPQYVTPQAAVCGCVCVCVCMCVDVFVCLYAHAYYRKISNISSIKSRNLNVSRLVLQLSFAIYRSQVLSRERRCRWSSADRRCSNYIRVINNFVTY